MSYVIITDSTTDLINEFVLEKKVEVIPMAFEIKGEEYKNYPDEREIKTKDFYDMLRQGEVSKTAQLTYVAISDVYRKYLEQGIDVLGVVFSSGLSGSFNAVRLAVNELKEEFPDRLICIVDSLAASMGEGLLVYYANKFKEEGLSVEENAQKLEELKFHLCHWFTIDDIDTLRRGGRLSNSKAFIAKNLHIKPVLHVDNEGHLVVVNKTIGRKNSLKALVNKMVDLFDSSYEQTIMIGHGDCIDDVNYLISLINDTKLPVKDIIVNSIGPVIGAHSGPGTVALFFVGKER